MSGNKRSGAKPSATTVAIRNMRMGESMTFNETYRSIYLRLKMLRNSEEHRPKFFTAKKTDRGVLVQRVR